MNCVVVVDSPKRAEAFRRERLPVAVHSETGPAEVIINWAAHVSRPQDWSKAFVLNRPEAVDLARSKSVRRRLWRYFGLGDGTARRSSHWYRVHVFDLRVVAAYKMIRSASRRRFKRVRASGGKELERAGESAFRALHALRLDFGTVDIAPRGDSFVVVGLNLAPPVKGKIARAYAEAIKRFLHRWHRPPRDFLLGADPEFVIRNRRHKRSLVIASRHLSREGRIGVDNQRMRGTRSARPIVEVRPPPSREPAVLVRSMRRLLRALPSALRRRNLGWYAGSGPSSLYPIGGHIHFGGIPLSAGLIRAMDTYLAVPVLLIEDSSRARKRRRRYGSLGEVRTKKWGFEYRTLPSWLVAPRFAEAVLCLAKLIGFNWRKLRFDPFLDPDRTQDFYKCRKGAFYEQFDWLWADLKSLPDYEAYAEALDAIPQLVYGRLRWAEERDFRIEWGLR